METETGVMSRGERSPTKPYFGTSDLQDRERINFCGLKCRVCRTWLWWHQGTDIPVLFTMRKLSPQGPACLPRSTSSWWRESQELSRAGCDPPLGHLSSVAAGVRSSLSGSFGITFHSPTTTVFGAICTQLKDCISHLPFQVAVAT